VPHSSKNLLAVNLSEDWKFLLGHHMLDLLKQHLNWVVKPKYEVRGRVQGNNPNELFNKSTEIVPAPQERVRTRNNSTKLS
jgi:hypothetical protein